MRSASCLTLALQKYLSEISNAEFCLCPFGYALWSFRLYESLAFDCIPVLFDEECAAAAIHMRTTYHRSATGLRATVHVRTSVRTHACVRE